MISITRATHSKTTQLLTHFGFDSEIYLRDVFALFGKTSQNTSTQPHATNKKQKAKSVPDYIFISLSSRETNGIY
jgi:hypothetical protein